MKLSDGIQAAYNKKWSMINTFDVKITMGAKLADAIGGDFSDDIDLHIVSLTTPDFTNQPIESFIANKWVIHNGRDELYRFSATFRDFNNMELYKKFYKIYHHTKDNYFDECKLTINIEKQADWHGQSDETFFTFEDTLVESVSNVSFSNDTENQIAEFSVNFKSTTPSIGK